MMQQRTMTTQGMSFIEMIMAIAILFIGMEGVTLLLLKSWDNNKFVLEMGNASFIASRGVGQVISEIRKSRQADNGDYPIESGDDFDLKLYIDIDNDGDTERVHYYLNGSSLYRGITNPVSGFPVTYPAGDDTTQVLAGSIANTPTDPVFYYYNDDYPTDTVKNPLTTPISVSDARMIKVHLMVNIDPLHAPDHINIESFVELRNLNNY